MIERYFVPEVATPLLHTIGLLVIAAITQKQRLKILLRDGGKSQMRHYTEEKGWHNGGYCEDEICEHLQVHHIETQRNGGGDYPENLITLSQCEHNGVCPSRKIIDGLRNGKYTNEGQFCVHPDIKEATMNYNGGDSFKKVFEARNIKVALGEPYHNQDHDEELLETALLNTQNAIIHGWRWED